MAKKLSRKFSCIVNEKVLTPENVYPETKFNFQNKNSKVEEKPKEICKTCMRFIEECVCQRIEDNEIYFNDGYDD